MAYSKDKISDILAVLEIVKKDLKNGGRFKDITELRKDAVNEFGAIELGCGRYRDMRSANRTLSDAMTRRLKPHIRGINDFDRLVEAWFCNGSNKLKDILLIHCVDASQRAQVGQFFSFK